MTRLMSVQTTKSHFCALQANLEEKVCCQLVRLLNVPDRVPFCANSAAVIVETANLTAPETGWSAENATVSRLFQHSYPKYGPPTMNAKGDAPEEHLIFLFGIFMLISMAVICTLFLMKLSKASAESSSARSTSRCTGGLLPGDYSLMLWMPKSCPRPHRPQSQVRRQPSLLLLLRSSFNCGSGSGRSERRSRCPSSTHGDPGSVSIVTSCSMNALLPPSLTITPSSSTGSSALSALCNSTKMQPPPPYEEYE